MKQTLVAFLILLLISSCKNFRAEKDTDSSTGDTIAEQNIKKPDVSDSDAKKLLSEFDYAVAALMSNISDFKESMDKGAKMTPVVENNLTDLLNEAKKAQANLTDELKNKLNEDDYGLYERSIRRVKEQETELEGLKQLK